MRGVPSRVSINIKWAQLSFARKRDRFGHVLGIQKNLNVQREFHEVICSIKVRNYISLPYIFDTDRQVVPKRYFSDPELSHFVFKKVIKKYESVEDMVKLEI